jgi:hypothetical protein
MYGVLYQGRVRLTEVLPTMEWARIGAFRDSTSVGEIPVYHRIAPPPDALVQLAAFNRRIQEAGLKTQNYDKGFDRFIRKFDS